MSTAAGRRGRVVLLLVALVVAAVVALTAGGRVVDPPPPGSSPRDGSAGSRALTEAVPIAHSTPPVPAVPRPGPPDMARLLEIADEVSADGRYVRIGDVEISASPVVTRGD
jgi:hypothetical protein